MNFLDFLGLWPVLNNFYFVIGHGKARRRKNVFRILYWLGVKFVFLCFSIKTSLAEMLEYFLNMLVIFRHVIWVDKYIIQIDHNTNIQNIGEEVIYKSLEGYENISKTEGHYRLLKWSIMCFQSSLPFITVGNANQVVSMVNIYLCIYSSFAK